MLRGGEKKKKKEAQNEFDLFCSQQGGSRFRAGQARAKKAMSVPLMQKDTDYIRF